MRLFLALAFTAIASAQTFDLTGYVAARGVNTTGPESWLDGGFGRLETGGDRDAFVGVAHLGADWRPARWLELHASAAGREDHAGIVEAHATLRKEFALDELQLRAGWFFLPTSRENRGDNWSSPYTIHFSALNTWIAQEVRPIGADLQYRHTTNVGHAITAGATAFRGNDTMGTILGWRGWSVGDRLTTYGEALPLPPIESLHASGPFWRQRDDGTQPFGEDLDGHMGYSARVRYAVPQRGNVQYTYVDNGGDRALYGDEYSWQTRFHLLGAELGSPDAGLLVAAEHMSGDTYMGIGTPFVAASFQTTYLLVSEKLGRNRWTARYELFGTEDLDRSAAEDNHESGRSWTLTWMFDVTSALRAAAELTQVTGDRSAARQYGFEPSTTGRSVTLEARWRF
jgi:hypothetical protein